MRIKHPIEIPDSVKTIFDIFKDNGYKLYLVGGAVRDTLMGRVPKDFDLATDAIPDKVKEMLHMYQTIESGEQFAVVNVVTDDGTYEIATFREDIGKGRRPDDVKFSTIEKDVLRRDLTINALFYDIDTQEIVDLVGGVDDLKKGVIKTVGDASERFSEDKLRIIRALRFAARVGSDVNEEIDKAIKADNSTISGNGKPLSQERIQDEFFKGIKQAKSVVHFIGMVKKYGLFKWVFQDLPAEGPIIQSKHLAVVVATLLRNGTTNLEEKLTELKFTMTSRSLPKHIEFLVKFFQEGNVDTAYDLKLLYDRVEMNPSILSEFGKANEMDKNFIKAFVRYEITTSGGDLARQGFRGKELGDEKRRIETEKFKVLMGKYIVDYSGIVLDENSHNELVALLFDLFTEEKGWEILAHHMTVESGPLPIHYRGMIGQKFDVTITDVGYDDNVVAVKVDTSFKTRGAPHITLAVNRDKGATPNMSNRIVNWNSLRSLGKEQFNVSGTLEEIPK